MIEYMHYYDVLFLFLCFAYYAGVSIYVLLINRRSIYNIAFAVMLFFFALWDLAILAAVANTDPGRVLFFYRLIPVPALIGIAFMFYFALLYPKSKDLPLWQKVLIFLPPLLFGYASLFTDQMFSGFQVVNQTFVYLGQRFYGRLYGSYIISQTFFVLGGAAITGIKTWQSRGQERRSCFFVFLAFLISGLGGLIFSLWLPRLGLIAFYSGGPISIFIGTSLIAYAILKFRLFTITPTIAAKEILNALGKKVVLSDLDAKVIYKGSGELLLNEQARRQIIDQVIKHGLMINQRLIIKGKPYIVSARFFKEGGSVLMVLHDITEIEQQQAEEITLSQELKHHLAAEKKLRLVLTSLVKSFSPEEEAEILRSAHEVFKDYLVADSMLKRMLSLTRERSRLLADLQQDKEALEAKLEELKTANKMFVQRELKMVELKEKIAQLKEAKGTL